MSNQVKNEEKGNYAGKRRDPESRLHKGERKLEGSVSIAHHRVHKI